MSRKTIDTPLFGPPKWRDSVSNNGFWSVLIREKGFMFNHLGLEPTNGS